MERLWSRSLILYSYARSFYFLTRLSTSSVGSLSTLLKSEALSKQSAGHMLGWVLVVFEEGWTLKWGTNSLEKHQRRWYYKYPLLALDFSLCWFLLRFSFISHAVQLLDARRTKVCPLFAARLFCSAQPHPLVCLSVSVSVCICSLLLADAVILFTKPVHSFICKNKVLVCVYL